MSLADLKKKIEDANSLGRTNLNAKGVTVNGAETTFQIMSKILNIPTGGGGGCDEDHEKIFNDGYLAGKEEAQGGTTTGRRTATGTFEFNVTETTPTIKYDDCGFEPSIFLVYPEDPVPSGTLMTLGCIIMNNALLENIFSVSPPQFILDNLTSSANWYSIGSTAANFGWATSSEAKLPHRNTNYKWQPNFTYGWLAIE